MTGLIVFAAIFAVLGLIAVATINQRDFRTFVTFCLFAIAITFLLLGVSKANIGYPTKDTNLYNNRPMVEGEVYQCLGTVRVDSRQIAFLKDRQGDIQVYKFDKKVELPKTFQRQGTDDQPIYKPYP